MSVLKIFEYSKSTHYVERRYLEFFVISNYSALLNSNEISSFFVNLEYEYEESKEVQLKVSEKSYFLFLYQCSSRIFYIIQKISVKKVV